MQGNGAKVAMSRFPKAQSGLFGPQNHVSKIRPSPKTAFLLPPNLAWIQQWVESTSSLFQIVSVARSTIRNTVIHVHGSSCSEQINYRSAFIYDIEGMQIS